MSEVWTKDQYLASQKSTTKKKNKFNATKVVIDGWGFDSKAEGNRYLYNKMRIQAGELLYQLCQVPFRLPGHTIYRCDFLECYADGTFKYVDVKGKLTSEFKLKKRQVEDLYPVEIVCIKQQGKGWIEV
ncbi:MAG: DUF1064 domain-containing protein [Gammaproteobacteria bacterium]|nr:DUF1064 domain-containing protein [Gammaproteobacteria bacterium]